MWKKNVDLENYDHDYTAHGYTPTYLDVLLKEDNFALIDDTISVIGYPEYQDCRVIRIPEQYLNAPVSWGVPKSKL